MNKRIAISGLILLGAAMVLLALKINFMDKIPDSVVGMCASRLGFGYVVDEYKNSEGNSGGFIVHSESTLGASSYLHDRDGNFIYEIEPLPSFEESPQGKAALAWEKELVDNFPVKTTYLCDK